MARVIDHISVLQLSKQMRCACTGGQELHGSPSTLSSAAGPYVPATLSSSETQGRASTQQSHSATFEAQVEAQVGSLQPEILPVGCRGQT